jgi:hypothetical protein
MTLVITVPAGVFAVIEQPGAAVAVTLKDPVAVAKLLPETEIVTVSV